MNDLKIYSHYNEEELLEEGSLFEQSDQKYFESVQKQNLMGNGILERQNEKKEGCDFREQIDIAFNNYQNEGFKQIQLGKNCGSNN